MGNTPGAESFPGMPPPSGLVQVGVDLDGKPSLLDVIPDAIIAVDSSGDIFLANHRAEAIFHTTVEDLVGRGVDELVPPDRRPRHADHRTAYDKEPAARAMHTLTDIEGVRLDDGSTFPVRVSLSPAMIAGRPCTVATIRDVSDTRSPSTVTKSVHDAPQYLSDTSVDLVAVLALDGTCTWISLSIERLAGLSPEEVLGRPLDRFIHDDDRSDWAKAIDRARVSRPTVQMDLRLGNVRAPDGYRWLAAMLTSTLGPNLEPVGFVVGFRDVHQFILADQARARSDRTLRVAMERSPVGMAQISPLGKILTANAALGRLVEREQLDLPGAAVTDVFDAERAPAIASLLNRATRADGEPCTAEIQWSRPDGDTAWVRLEASAVRTAEGDLDHLIVQFVDLTEAREAARRTSVSEHRYKLLAQNSTDVVVEIGKELLVSWASPSVETALGVRASDLTDRPLAELALWEDRREFASHVAASLESGQVATWTTRLRTGHDDWRWMSVRFAPVVDGNHDAAAVVGLVDVNDLVLAQEAMTRSERMFRLAMDGAPQGMAVVGLHRYFLRVNEALERTLGRSADWLLKHTLADVIHPEDLQADLVQRDELLIGNQTTMSAHRRLVGAGGETIFVTHSASILRDENGMPLYFVEQFQDVSEARESQRQLDYQATHDELTGLMNRREFLARASALFGAPERSFEAHAVLLVDMDHLSRINREFGHESGDDVLIAAAGRIRSAVRNDDVVARMGGDEFVVVLAGVANVARAEAVARTIREAIAQPIRSSHRAIDGATATVGAAIAGSEQSLEAALNAAGSALGRARRHGGDAVFVADARPKSGQ